MCFEMKKFLKNNRYYIFKHPLNVFGLFIRSIYNFVKIQLI